MSQGIQKAQDRYEGWWLGKMCRITHGDKTGFGPFKKVVKVEAIGNPSFVYGMVELTYEDETREFVYCGNAFKPRKRDVEIQTEE